jgi:peptide/nickel transport system substrate-binding protein
MTPQKDLASSFSTSKSGKYITVRLIRTKFQDGKSLTASDVKFTVEAFKAAGKKCEYKDMVDAISSVSVLGSRTLRIYFNDSTDMSLEKLTFPILPSHRYSGTSDLNSQKSSFKPVGTGQYKYSSYDKTSELVLKAYSGYHGTAAKSTVKFTVIPNKSSAYNLLQSSTLSLLVSDKQNREANIDNSTVKTVNFPSSQMEMIGFNMKSGATKNKYVRQAVAMAVNSSKIAETAYSGSAMVNDNLYFPNYLDQHFVKQFERQGEGGQNDQKCPRKHQSECYDNVGK